jgi:hypothetical protein
MKRWLLLGAPILAAAVVLALATRTEAPPEAVESTRPPLPVFRTEAEVGAGGTDPYRIQVPKDHEIHLILRAGPDVERGRLVVVGYESQVEPLKFGPGQAEEIVFESVRPGDDFAITLDETVLGRLQVTGSHLEEGHQ